MNKTIKDRLCILNYKLTLKNLSSSKYFNGYVRPIQELKKNRILARRIFVKKYGYFTRYNQDCSKVGYECKICSNKQECDLSRKLSSKDSHIYKLTRMAEILYGNLNHGYWADLVEY